MAMWFQQEDPLRTKATEERLAQLVQQVRELLRNWTPKYALAEVNERAPKTSGVYKIYAPGKEDYVSRGQTTNLRQRLNQHRLQAKRFGDAGLQVSWALVPENLLWLAEQSIPKGSGDTLELEMESELGGGGGGFGPATTAVRRQRQFTEPVAGRWTRRSPRIIVVHLGSVRVGPR